MRTDWNMFRKGKYRPRHAIPFVRGFRVGAHWVTLDGKPRPSPRRVRRAFRRQMTD